MPALSRKYILLLLLSGYFMLPAGASDSLTVLTETRTIRHFDHAQWNTLKQKLKIRDYAPEKPKAKKDRKAWKLNISPAWASVLKWSFFILLILLLSAIIIYTLGIQPFRKQDNNTTTEVSAEQLEENLDKADIDPHLYAAIKSRNYRMAIRLYYLLIIQKLANKGKIQWKRSKTNQHYLQELHSGDDYNMLKNLTRIYEQVWFGASDLEEKEYDRIQPAFVNYLQNIRD